MSELKVLTLNIWGLWLVSQKREQRVRYLAEYLRMSTEDVVLLQEVWVDSDAQLLIRAGKAAGLLHCTHFRSGRFGSGLVTLSRHPITRHSFWRYAAAGFATSISCGDFYAGKGVGWVRLATPLGDVDLFNTHLHANYCHDYRLPAATLCKSAAAATAAITAGSADAAVEAAAGDADVGNSGDISRARLLQGPEWLGSRIPDDDDAGTRISQLLELSELVDLISGSSSSKLSSDKSSGSSGGGISGSSSSRLVVLAGDLNCKPDTLEIDVLRMRLPALRDAWLAAAERSTNSASSASVSNSDSDEFKGSAVCESNPEGFTCHAPGNTYQPRRQVPERIDYVWSNMACSRAEVALQMTPGGAFSYSDHFAVRAALRLPAGPSSPPPPPGPASAGTGKLGAMKLGSMFTKGATAAGTEQRQQQQQQQAFAGGGEGDAMAVGRKVATALAAVMLLEEGIRSFSADSAVMTALAGFTLVSVVYSAIALPVFMPEVAFRGAVFSVVLLAAGAAAAAGTALLVMGALADRSQQRALQSSYRQLRVWMQQHLGLQGTAGLSVDAGDEDAAAAAGPQRQHQEQQ